MSGESGSKYCPRGQHRGCWPGGAPPLDRFTDGTGWGCPGILPDGSPCDYELRTFPVPPMGPAELREHLGRVVRDTWVVCAGELDDPKPSHLVGWDELDDWNKEVDRRIGAAVAAEVARLMSGHYVEAVTDDMLINGGEGRDVLVTAARIGAARPALTLRYPGQGRE